MVPLVGNNTFTLYYYVLSSPVKDTNNTSISNIDPNMDRLTINKNYENYLGGKKKINGDGSIKCER